MQPHGISNHDKPTNKTHINIIIISHASLSLGPLSCEASFWTKVLVAVEAVSVEAFRTTIVAAPISVVPVALRRSMIISSIYSVPSIVVVTISEPLMPLRPIVGSIIPIGTSVATSVRTSVRTSEVPVITTSIISRISTIVTLRLQLQKSVATAALSQNRGTCSGFTLRLATCGT